MNDLKQKVVKGAFWQLLQQFSTQIVQFVVGMVLARLLVPSDYGTVALTSIFFAVAGQFVDSGFGGALVQKKDADDLDFNSVFYLSLVMASLVYTVMFFAAPYIAAFYDVPILTPIVRVSATCFIFNAINSIQNAELYKKMLFHLSFRINLITCFTSAITGVTLAYLGFGVWALVWSSIAAGVAGVIARWTIVAWRPKLMFSFARLWPLFQYGWKMLASAIMAVIFENLSSLLIGKFYTKSDLAFVNKGRNAPNIFMSVVDGTLGSVTFPALVQLQDDVARLRDATRRTIQCSTFLVFPLMTGIAFCSEDAIVFLYGEQWRPAAVYMMIACWTYALWPFHTVNLRAITAMGRSDIFLKLEIIKKILAIVVIFTSIRYGVLAFVLAGAVVSSPLSVLINSWPNRKLLGYSIRMQIIDVMPTFACCMVMGLMILGVGCLVDHGFAVLFGGAVATIAGVKQMLMLGTKLLFQALIGGIAFLVLAYSFRLRPMGEYVAIMAKSLGGKFPRFSETLQNHFAH